jgi:hypothetical protein
LLIPGFGGEIVGGNSGFNTLFSQSFRFSGGGGMILAGLLVLLCTTSSAVFSDDSVPAVISFNQLPFHSIPRV